MLIEIPDFSLIVLIGCAGSDKKRFAEHHFPAPMIVSNETCRRMAGVQSHDLESARDINQLMLPAIGMRLKRRQRTVIDAYHLTVEARRPLVELARRYHARLVAIVCDLPLEYCLAHLNEEPGVDAASVTRQYKNLQNQRRSLNHEGFHEIFTLRSPEDLERSHIRWLPAAFDRRHIAGPFDIIGDIHGCATELVELIRNLGYTIDVSGDLPSIAHPEGRRLVFVGDLIDRGPAVVAVLQIVMATVRSGQGYCVIGNHENKLIRYLNGRRVKISHGLERTIEQLERMPPRFREDVLSFMSGLSDHLIFDEERLVIAHAGIREDYIGRSSGEVRAFCLYGETNGELDEHGLPVRLPWARNYGGQALVVYGHTPVTQPLWTHNTVNIDTGCVFGGALSALRYPEREIVSVPAHERYYEAKRPFVSAFAQPVTAALQAVRSS